jgi:hypothetical protein
MYSCERLVTLLTAHTKSVERHKKDRIKYWKGREKAKKYQRFINIEDKKLRLLVSCAK